MFGFIVAVPRRIKNLFSKFRKFFSKPQYENFCRTELGLIVAGGKEHDVKSINELFIDRKEDQSSLNRFITHPKWDSKAVANQAKTLLLSEANLDTYCSRTRSSTIPCAASTAKSPRWSVTIIPQPWEQC